ncbi:MAG TPA: hypothetical protein DCK76_08660 [Desulfotomaculum sp.]|nr:hypothetical protein [Desulfotomaculum sp.]
MLLKLFSKSISWFISAAGLGIILCFINRGLGIQEQVIHLLRPSLALVFNDPLQFPKVVVVAEGMVTVFIYLK